MAAIAITHYTDPGCPFAYSAAPALTALQWRYGAQLGWRHVMIGLTEDAEQYAERGYTPLRMLRGNRRFARHGMPFGRQPKPHVAATSRACRAIVAVRLLAPELEYAAFRSLQLTHFTTGLALDDDAALLDALARVPGVDPHEIVARVDSSEVIEAYEADRAEARTAEGTPTEFQGKAANTDGAVRYTAPSLVFTRAWRRFEAGGSQPLEAYDVLLANLDPTLDRRGPATDVAELLAAFPHGLTTREVATCCAPPMTPPDDGAAEDALAALAVDGRALAVPFGDGTLWVDAASPFAAVAPAGAALGLSRAP